jgi:cytochrome c556
MVAVLGLLALGQCRPSPGESSQSPAERGEAVRFAMDEHFMDISAIRDAVVDGDLATVTELSERLQVRESESDHPTEWDAHIDAVVALAGELRAADGLAPAAAKTAELGAACGACHHALDVHPPFDDAVEPGDDDSGAGIMRRHQWATERLWEGVVGPSDWAWTRGADAFADPPGCVAGTDLEICATLHALGPRLVAATEPDTRATLYGELLGTCAACHAG